MSEQNVHLHGGLSSLRPFLPPSISLIIQQTYNKVCGVLSTRKNRRNSGPVSILMELTAQSLHAPHTCKALREGQAKGTMGGLCMCSARSKCREVTKIIFLEGLP